MMNNENTTTNDILDNELPTGLFTKQEAAVLKVGDAYTFTAQANSNSPPMFRLIHKNPKTNTAWAIEIPHLQLGGGHAKAPFSLPLDKLFKLLEEHKIVSVHLADPPILTMSDDEIKERYQNKSGRCPILDIRDARFDVLQKLIGRHSTGEILELGLTASWVNEQTKISHRSRAKLYDDLHTYWAGNFAKNALLPRYWRSGAKGRERVQNTKLGRPNAKAQANPDANRGYFLSGNDKKQLQYGWKYFLSAGRTRYQAYIETMTAFYSDRWEMQNGQLVPILLSPELRPTFAQFDRWGPDGDARLTASRIQIGEIDWAKKYQGLIGSAKDGIVAVGMQAACDTTTNDTYLKSVVSRLKTVGPVNRLLIAESRSELIFGLHCGFDPPSARTFLLAVAHGASEKVEFCERFGITITDEDWPACAARTYLGDNGEYRNKLSRQALTQFESSVDYIPSGQPQFNSTAESKHHLLHARVDHTLPGTTHGEPRRRGKQHPAIDACINYYEYMHELIREILYHNNEEQVPRLLTAEMRRAQVKPTRLSIYRWLIENGYSVDFAPNINRLRAYLLPSLPATMTESGVYLLREDRGDKDERIPNVRYMGDYLIESGLLEQARRNGNRRISVRGDPTDPRKVWLQTEFGLAELANIDPDPILYRQATLADLTAIKDDDKLTELENRGQMEQTRAVISASREALVNQARADKKLQMDALSKPMTKADHYNNIEENRKTELTHLENQIIDTNLDQPDLYKQPNTRPENSSVLTEHNSADSTYRDDLQKDTFNPALIALLKYKGEKR